MVRYWKRPHCFLIKNVIFLSMIIKIIWFLINYNYLRFQWDNCGVTIITNNTFLKWTHTLSFKSDIQSKNLLYYTWQIFLKFINQPCMYIYSKASRVVFTFMNKSWCDTKFKNTSFDDLSKRYGFARSLASKTNLPRYHGLIRWSDQNWSWYQTPIWNLEQFGIQKSIC